MPFARQALLVYASHASNAVFPLIVSPIIVRRAGIEVFGELALLLLASQFALLVSEYSFEVTASRRVVKSADPGRILSTVMLAKLFLLPLSISVFSVVVFMTSSDLFEAKAILATVLMSVGLAIQAPWYAIATRQGGALASANILGRLISAGSVILLLGSVGLKAVDLYLAIALGTVAAGAVFLLLNKCQLRASVARREAVEYILEGRSVFCGTAVSTAQNMLGQAMAGMFLSASAMGRYAAVDRVARSGSAVLKPLFQIAFPRMASLHESDPARARALVKLAALSWVMVSVVLLFGVWALGEEVLVLMFGPELKGSRLLSTVLVAWISLGVFNNVMGVQGLLAAGHDSYYAKSMSIGFASTLILASAFVALSEHVGPEMVALSVLIGELVIAVLYLYGYMGHRIGVRTG